jgi:hypothetical protein
VSVTSLPAIVHAPVLYAVDADAASWAGVTSVSYSATFGNVRTQVHRGGVVEHVRHETPGTFRVRPRHRRPPPFRALLPAKPPANGGSCGEHRGHRGGGFPSAHSGSCPSSSSMKSRCSSSACAARRPPAPPRRPGTPGPPPGAAPLGDLVGEPLHHCRAWKSSSWRRCSSAAARPRPPAGRLDVSGRPRVPYLRRSYCCSGRSPVAVAVARSVHNTATGPCPSRGVIRTDITGRPLPSYCTASLHADGVPRSIARPCTGTGRTIGAVSRASAGVNRCAGRARGSHVRSRRRRASPARSTASRCVHTARPYPWWRAANAPWLFHRRGAAGLLLTVTDVRVTRFAGATARAPDLAIDDVLCRPRTSTPP